MGQNISFDVIARDRASSTFSRIGRSSDTTMARLVRFGKSTAGLVGFASLTTAAAGFVKVGGEYVGSLNKIQALTGANQTTMQRAAKTLESQSSTYAKMGQTTGDAAGGVVELAKAGLSLDKSLKAVNATMVLAKAGELSVADASSLVANTLNTFHLKASKAGDIANYLANAANISSADVTDLAESFKYVSPIAAATGVSLAQTNAILAELSNSGIAASNAGTGFRKFLLSLQAPSGAAAKDLKALNVEIFDAQGKMKPLGTVIDQLNGKLSKLTDQQRQRVLKDLFGLQGVSAAQVILKNGSKGLEDYTRGVKKAGAAQKLAEAASKGFTGTLSALRAEVISDAQAAYRELSPSLDTAAKKLLEFVQQMKSGQGTGGDFVRTVKDLATVAKKAVEFLDGLPGPVKRFGIEGLIAYGVIRKLNTATGGWGASLTSTVAKAKQFNAELTYMPTRTQRVTAAAQAMGGMLRNLAGAGGLLLVSQSMNQADDSSRVFQRTVGGALTGLAMTANPVGAAAGAIIGFGTAVAQSGKRAKSGFSGAAAAADAYAASLSNLTGKMTRNTHATVVQSLAKDNDAAVRAANALGISTDVLANKLMGRHAAEVKVNQAIREGLLSGKMMTYANGGQARAADVLTQALGGMAQETANGTRKTKGLTQSFREAQAEAAVAAKRGRDLSFALKGIPTKVATKIANPGGPQSLRDIEKLIDRYHRTPTEVRTLVRALGINVTDAQLRTLIDHSKTLDRTDPAIDVTANTAAARAQLGAFSAYLTSVTRPRSVDVTIRRHATGGIDSLLGQTTGGGKGRTGGAGGRFAGGFGRGSERAIDSNMRAAAVQTMTIKRALSKFGDALSNVTSQLSSLKDLRQSFLDTFKADSVFGADLSGGGGLDTLLNFQAQQASQASQLLADVRNVVSRGLSKDLVAQLQAQGTSGAQQLHAIAGGSNAQIALLNSLNAQTSSSLTAAGMLAGNTVRGGSIDADIARAAREEALVNHLLAELRRLEPKYVAVEIDSEVIIRAIKKRNTRKGVKTAGM